MSARVTTAASATTTATTGGSTTRGARSRTSSTSAMSRLRATSPRSSVRLAVPVAAKDSQIRSRSRVSESRIARWRTSRSAYLSTVRASPKNRTPTIATSRYMIGGWNEAWTMSHAETPVSAAPAATAPTPQRTARRKRGERMSTARESLRRIVAAGSAGTSGAVG